MTPVWVIGNGGHAKVAIDAIKMLAHLELAGILCDDPNPTPVEEDVAIRGPITLQTVRMCNIKNACIGIGDNGTRSRIADLLVGIVNWITIVHPSAVIARSAVLGKGCLVAAGAVVQPGVTLGDHVIVNTSSSIDHDCVVQSFAHIGPGAHLAGNITVGSGSLIGVGSSIIPGLTIGRWSIVGAGSVVIRSIPEYQTVVGCPADSIH